MVRYLDIKMVSARGFEPRTPTVSRDSNQNLQNQTIRRAKKSPIHKPFWLLFSTPVSNSQPPPFQKVEKKVGAGVRQEKGHRQCQEAEQVKSLNEMENFMLACASKMTQASS